MKKKLIIPVLLILSVGFIACGSKKESAAAVAQKWCDLNGKAHKAAEGAEKEAAEQTLKKFEDEMETKYKDNETFLKEVEKEVNKCEDASEGR